MFCAELELFFALETCLMSKAEHYGKIELFGALIYLLNEFQVALCQTEWHF
jgi:hypothetical protein